MRRARPRFAAVPLARVALAVLLPAPRLLAALLPAAVGLAAALLAAGAPAAAAAPAASPPAAPANADTGAVVTVALGVAVPTLDPGIPAGTPAATVRRHIYEGLVSMTEDGKIVPELASEWTVSKDGLTWTFKLAKGVQFHDGTPFDAAAMKASLDRILDPKEALPNRRYLEAIDRVEAPDPQTVRIVLKEPFGAFLQHLAYDQGFAVSPAALAKHGKDIAKNPVGTGPYRRRSTSSWRAAVADGRCRARPFGRVSGRRAAPRPTAPSRAAAA